MKLIETWESRRNPTPVQERTSKQLGWLIFGLCLDISLIFSLLAVGPAIDYLKHKYDVPMAKLPTLNESKRGVALYDRSDHYLCTLHNEQDCQPVSLDKVSVNMRNALLAAEDRHFYQHCGIDFGGVARALKTNWNAGHVVQGASTITQQLVRNLFLDKNDKTLKRKIKEAYLACEVDHNYSKPKILETYLNVVYFGGGVFGIERAAQHYFNKHASQLSIPESAFLAGVICCPSVLGAPENLKLALNREQTVINKMDEYGFITDAAAEQAKATKLAFESGPEMVPYPYYITYAMQELKRKVGDELWTHGWKVYTNLDVPSQKAAESVLNKGIAKAPKGIDQGALVSMSVKDGAVLAMVGGVGAQSQWNRAIYPHTAGSSFKPFVYLAAMADGVIMPDTLIDDAPLTLQPDKYSAKWEPKNFDGRFMGWIPTRTALALSRNVCSIRVAMETGLARVIEVAKAAGIKTQLDAFPSLALGSCAVTPMDMTTSYATLARGGIYMQPQLFRTIESDDGKIKVECKTSSSENLPAEPVSELVDAMQDVVRSGTGTSARLPGIEVAGKTGTADNGKDLWFIGFTPDTVTAVWAGNDLNHAVAGKHVTGGDVMARIWHDYMKDFYQLHKPPTGIAFAQPKDKLIAAAPRVLQGSASELVTEGTPGSDAAAFTSKLASSGIVRAGALDRGQALRERQHATLAVASNPQQVSDVAAHENHAAPADASQWRAHALPVKSDDDNDESGRITLTDITSFPNDDASITTEDRAKSSLREPQRYQSSQENHVY